MKYLLALLLALFNTASYADELENCLNKSHGTQFDQFCYAEEAEKQDRALNEQIAEMEKLPTDMKPYEAEGLTMQTLLEQRALLVKSQTAWNQYRESWCGYLAATINGSGRGSMYSQCRLEMTKRRLQDFKHE